MIYFFIYLPGSYLKPTLPAGKKAWGNQAAQVRYAQVYYQPGYYV